MSLHSSDAAITYPQCKYSRYFRSPSADRLQATPKRPPPHAAADSSFLARQIGMRNLFSKSSLLYVIYNIDNTRGIWRGESSRLDRDLSHFGNKSNCVELDQNTFRDRTLR